MIGPDFLLLHFTPPQKVKETLEADPRVESKGEEASSSSSAPASESTAAATAVEEDTRTEAEIQFERIQVEREKKLLAKTASKSYRDRINEFNEYLENLSEHHDIPRVGPG